MRILSYHPVRGRSYLGVGRESAKGVADNRGGGGWIAYSVPGIIRGADFQVYPTGAFAMATLYNLNGVPDLTLSVLSWEGEHAPLRPAEVAPQHPKLYVSWHRERHRFHRFQF